MPRRLSPTSSSTRPISTHLTTMTITTVATMVTMVITTAPLTMSGETPAAQPRISTVATSTVPSATSRGPRTRACKTHGITGMPLAGARGSKARTTTMVVTMAHHLLQTDSSRLLLSRRMARRRHSTCRPQTGRPLQPNQTSCGTTTITECTSLSLSNWTQLHTTSQTCSVASSNTMST